MLKMEAGKARLHSLKFQRLQNNWLTSYFAA